jgi:hypothetical protein
MRLNENEVNNYLQTHLGQYEDSFQQAWLEIVERDPQTFDEIPPITRRIRNRALKQYLNKKFTEQSLHDPIGRNGDERFTLESILASPAHEDTEENDNGSNRFYKKIVDFLIEEYLSQKNENLAFKRKEMDLKEARLRLRKQALKFKKDRFESWKKLMEDKGKQKEDQFKLKVQLRREELEFKKDQFALMADKVRKFILPQM